jgi:hypothetical protein
MAICSSGAFITTLPADREPASGDGRNTIPWQKQNILPHNGWAPTAREASRKVEGLYEQIKGLHGR